MTDTQTIPIHAKFRGLYDTGLNEPDPQGLASVLPCIRPREDDRVRVTRRQDVIKEAEALSRFIDGIPKKVMACFPNPPPSDDPLLQRPAIDFESRMMLVIMTHNPNLFVDVEIAKVELTSGTMLVHCRYSEPGPVLSKVISYGIYLAAVVDRFDGNIHFVEA